MANPGKMGRALRCAVLTWTVAVLSKKLRWKGAKGNSSSVGGTQWSPIIGKLLYARPCSGRSQGIRG